MWPAIAAGAGALFGGIASGLGQAGANQANKDIASAQMAFNREEAVKQRDWQEGMARNSYRYGMADMKAAGLNPMLAFSQGGSSTPSGAQASSSAAPTMQNTISPVVSSAQDAISKMLTANDMKSQADLRTATAVREAAQAKAADASAVQTEATTRKLNAEFGSVKGKAELEQLQQKWDKKSIDYDNFTRRIQHGLDAGKSAKDLFNPFNLLKGIFNSDKQKPEGFDNKDFMKKYKPKPRP